MKKIPVTAIIFFLLVCPNFQAAAQSTASKSSTPSASFDMTGFPQWTKDVRRWEIIAFGTFPFTVFLSTFAMDTYRWGKEADMGWDEASRRYAPWPLKAAGAVEMSSRERETTLIAAAGISVGLAFIDLVIVQIKRHKERRRAESLPHGTAIINRQPYPEEAEDPEEPADANAQEEEAAISGAPDSPVP